MDNEIERSDLQEESEIEQLVQSLSEDLAGNQRLQRRILERVEQEAKRPLLKVWKRCLLGVIISGFVSYLVLIAFYLAGPLLGFSRPGVWIVMNRVYFLFVPLLVLLNFTWIEVTNNRILKRNEK